MLDQSEMSKENVVLHPTGDFIIILHLNLSTRKRQKLYNFELSCVCASGVDFWSEVAPHSEQVDLMVEPSQVSKVNPYVITPYAI